MLLSLHVLCLGECMHARLFVFVCVYVCVCVRESVCVCAHVGVCAHVLARTCACTCYVSMGLQRL